MVSRKPTGQGPRSKTPGSGRRPVDPKTRKRILEMASESPQPSRNAIARECGVSPSTVTRLVAEALPDHRWDRADARAAVAAKAVDMKAARSEHAAGLLDDMGKLRASFFADRKRVHFSVTNGREEYSAPPTPGELKDLAVAYGILVDKHLVLVRHDSDDRDLPAVERWLGEMMGRGATVAA